MARNGPPDDFHNQPTQFADYGRGRPPAGQPPPEALPAEESQHPAEAPFEDQWPEAADPLDEPEPTPWYRKPAALIGWTVAVLVLLGLIAFGVHELINGDQGGGPTPSTSTTTPSTMTTTAPTTTPTTTEPSQAPPNSTAMEPPAQQPTQRPPQQQPRQPTQQPTHHHHLPPLPPVITIPDGPVVTVPPGLR